MKNLICIICLVLVATIYQQLVAQEVKCAMDLMEKIQDDPIAMQKMQASEDRLQQRIQAYKQGANDSIYIIPVVIHVLYNTPEENISDEQIQSQLDVLNEDFRRKNADTVNTRIIFLAFAGDTRIEFCLAKVDPNGDSTGGVTRTFSNRTSFNYFADDQVKLSANGGKDPWPSDDYLNIWVCDLLGGAGWGYPEWYDPPGEPYDEAFDGVVIDYQSFGRTGIVITPPLDKGRTGTHEVGHWLNLWHTFQGNCNGQNESDCSTKGDRVCDSPQQSGGTFGCPVEENDFVDTPVDLPNMIENYLDYTNDVCMNMFTKGQAERMRAHLTIDRASILSSPGSVQCTITYPDTPPPPQTGITEINSDKSIDMVVYPNPTTGWINIVFHSNNPTRESVLTIYNVMGKQISTQTIQVTNKKQLQLNLSAYAAGIYLIKLISDQLVAIKKMVIVSMEH